jgi:excisionase family DNA binding protein
LERKAISIAQACQSVGVSRRTIYNWMAAGKVEYVRTAGGAVRIFEDTLWRTPQTVSSVTYRATDTAADRGRLERA